MASASDPSLEPSRWLTPANLLTGLRLLLAPVCATAIACEHAVLAAAAFAVAVVTDLADGRVARSRGETSARGALFDHATDATFVTLGLAAVGLSSGEVPLVLPALVAAAFVQYVTDSRAHIGRHLRASALGRWNGIAYFVLLGVPVVRDVLGIGWPPSALVRALGWALVATTLVSALDRLSAGRRVDA